MASVRLQPLPTHDQPDELDNLSKTRAFLSHQQRFVRIFYDSFHDPIDSKEEFTLIGGLAINLPPPILTIHYGSVKNW